MSEARTHAAPDAGLLDGAKAEHRWWILAALVWLACVVAVAAHQWQFWRQGRLNTDVLALLPQSEQAPEVARAGRVLADRVSRQIVVLLGAREWEAAREGARHFRNSLAGDSAPLKPAAEAGASAEALLAYYAPWRDRLLTPSQRERLLSAAPSALVQAALSSLHQPGMGARLHEWAADPLGLWPEWLQSRAGQSKARPRDGELWVQGDGLQWVVLAYETTGSPFAMDGEPVYSPALGRALAAAQAVAPDSKSILAGLPLHAEAAAVQAAREINTIGWGSLAAVLLLAWLAFRGFVPIGLTALSLVIGTAAGLSATAWLFGEVHLLTMVFGVSLVGVAEDYGIHYFAARQGQPQARPMPLMRRLLPGLWLALATSVLAYMALGLAPFPGLRQMAVFCSAGLLGAFLTAVCWFPLLDRGTIRASGFARAISDSLSRWPRARASRRLEGALVLSGVVCAVGLWQLQVKDDIRHWQSSPAALLRAQLDAGRLLGVASVAQFYVVTGASSQDVLEREEALKRKLDAIVAAGGLAGYSAASDWIPSRRRQEHDAALLARTETQVLAGVNAALGESLKRPGFATGALLPEEWARHPASAGARALWLGEQEGQWQTVVMLQGLHDASVLARLSEAAQGLAGVRWVDKSAEVSAILARYRWAMAALLLAGHAAVFLALWLRYRGEAWRAWVPTAMASIATLACFGWIGEPFQLSTVLALLLLLGIGVDYGIFLLEHDGDGSAWLAVVLGAASTWLAFGLLALSSTPALHSFGLALLIGIALVWAASPWLRREHAMKAVA